ncbi:MAG: maleylpyruvate isomerase N-terminal domain-containing protein [Acidobacteriota bacterium]
MRPLEPIDTRNLFAPLHGELMALLRALTADDWEKQTVARAWRVRDVAAHLLDTQLRRLSGQRDGHRLPPDRPLVEWLNELNATWVAAASRFSPRVIVDLLDVTGHTFAAFIESLPLHERAPFGVAWAGEAESENWFDIGREYTEWWHHQMQIRDAVGAPLLLEPRWLEPLLEISVRVFRGIPDTVVFDVDGCQFSVVRGEVYRGAAPSPAATVRTDADTAWRMLFHALSHEEILARVTISGDAAAAEPLLRARSVMV